MKNSGFTLMEVLVAMVILAGALTVLNNSSSSSVASVRKAEKIQQISRLQESKMVEMELLNRGLSFEEMKKAESGDFGSNYPDLRWDMKMSEFPAPNLASLANQNEGQDELMLTILNKFSEHLEKSVMEMKVSVYWTVDENTLEYSVTTLLVNYDAKISMQ